MSTYSVAVMTSLGGSFSGCVPHRTKLETKTRHHTSSPQNSLVAQMAQDDEHPFLSRQACEELAEMLPHLHRRYLVRRVAIPALRAIVAKSTLEDVNAWAAAHLWMPEAGRMGIYFKARRWCQLRAVHGTLWKSSLGFLAYQSLEPFFCIQPRIEASCKRAIGLGGQYPRDHVAPP